MTASVRILLPDDWQTLRSLRLAALLDAPEAFASTYESTLARTEEEWRSWPAGGVVFAAVVGDEPVGMVAGALMLNDPATAHLIAMWVAPAVRGTGVAESLIDAVVAWAERLGFQSVLLEVAIGNERAAAVYLRNGFDYSDDPPSIPHTRAMRRPLR